MSAGELYVLLQVGPSEYVIPARDVLEMETFSEPTAVPGAARFVAGLVQIRGRVLPLIDLAARFGLPVAPRTLAARIVVVQRGERQVGLLADRAREVVHLASAEFRPAPELLSQRAERFVDAVIQVERRLLMRIDTDRVIARDRDDDERAGAAAPAGAAPGARAAAGEQPEPHEEQRHAKEAQQPVGP